MKKNIGSFDGVARMILGFVLFAYGTLVGPWWIALLAILPVSTAALFYCPLYHLAAISTDQDGKE